jgi:uncharacterized membrane protein
MHLPSSLLSLLVLVSLALSVFVVLLLAPAALRTRMRRPASGAPLEQRVDFLLDQQARQIRRLESAVRELAEGDRTLGGLLEHAVAHVGVVRFDAFEDMGGRLSFSAALLDGHGDGVVFTSINGRQDTRSYAKEVRGGTSAHHLSDEERQAIRQALAGREERAAGAGEGQG